MYHQALVGFGVGLYLGRPRASCPLLSMELQVEYALGKASNNAVSPGNAFCLHELRDCAKHLTMQISLSTEPSRITTIAKQNVKRHIIPTDLLA